MRARLLPLLLLLAAASTAAVPARAGELALEPFLERRLDGMPTVPPFLARPGGRALLVAVFADRVAAFPLDEEKAAWEYRPPRAVRRAHLSHDHAHLLLVFENGDAGAVETRTGRGAPPKEPLAGVRDSAVLPAGFVLLTGTGVRLFDPAEGRVETISGEKEGRLLATLPARGGSNWIAVASVNAVALHRSDGGAFSPAGNWRGDFGTPVVLHLHFASEEDAAGDRPRVAAAAPDRVRRFAREPTGLKELPAVEELSGVHALVSWIAPEGGAGTLAAVTPGALVALGEDGRERWRHAASFPPGTLPAFVYRYERPPFLALAALPAGGELLLLDPSTGTPTAKAALDGRSAGAPLLALPASLVKGDERDALLLGGVRLDAAQFFKCSGGGPLVRAESAALVPALHETLPEPVERVPGFSLRRHLDPAALMRLYAANRDAVHCGAGGLLALVALALWMRRRRRPRGLTAADLKAQVERLREMHEKSPENVEILLNLAMLLEKLGDPEPVIECYKSIVKLRPMEEIYYEKILDLGSPHFPYVDEVAAIYRRKGKVKAGIAAYEARFERLEAKGVFDPAVARLLARFRCGENQPEAIPLLRRLLAADPSLLDERRLLADALEGAGEPEAAMEQLLQLSELDRTPEGLKAAARFVRLAHGSGMTAEAAEQFRLALETRKGAAEELIPLAEDLLDAALGRGEKRSILLFADCLADARQRARDLKGALAALDRALGKFPKEPALARRRAFLLLEIGDHPDLLPAFEALHRDSPDDARVKFEYARLLSAAGRARECLVLCVDATKKGQQPEKFAELFAGLALEEVRAGRAEEAARALTALYAAGKSARLLSPLAECHLRLGDLDRAGELYVGYLKAAPDDARAKERHKYVATLVDERRLAEMKAAEAGDFAGAIELVIDGEPVRVRREGERGEAREKVSPVEMKTAEAKLFMRKAQFRKAIPVLQELLRLQAGRKESLATLLTLVTCFLKERLAAAACKVFDSFDLEPYGLSPREAHTVRYRAARLFEEYDELRQAEAIYAAILADDVGFMDAADRLAAVRRGLVERERSVVAAPVDDGEKTVIQQAKGEQDYIDRRYKVAGKLGKGGMGVVFRARDEEEGRDCAIKIPLVQFKDDRALIERFEREASLMERLKHPNVLEIFRVHRGELPYIVMEILDGRSLREILKERKSLPVPECRDLAVQICDALDYTHALKIVHRDIKPENIMVVAGNVR